MLRDLMENKTVKTSIAIVMIVLAGGAWGLLDYLNRQEEASAFRMQQEMLQMRRDSQKRNETAKKLADAKVSLETQIRNNLASCQAAAEKTNNDYLVVVEKTLPRKRGQVVMPQNIVNESAQLLEAAKAECQLIHDTLMQKVL